MSTATVHRRIEQLAAGLLDVLPAIEADPAVRAESARIGALQAGPATMTALAAGYALKHGEATTVSYERGPELVLGSAALIDVLFGDDRTDLEWCPHRKRYDDAPVMITAALRFAGCPPCSNEHGHAAEDQLSADNSCDVCGSDAPLLRMRLMPFAAAMVTVFTGACCDPLFDYAEPMESTTFRRLGRNEPCPCGSGYKFKRCHGRAVEA